MTLFVESLSWIKFANNLVYRSNLACASELKFTYFVYFLG